MGMVPANIWRFGFSPYNFFFILVPANIEYLVLVLSMVFKSL